MKPTNKKKDTYHRACGFDFMRDTQTEDYLPLPSQVSLCQTVSNGPRLK